MLVLRRGQTLILAHLTHSGRYADDVAPEDMHRFEHSLLVALIHVEILGSD